MEGKLKSWNDDKGFGFISSAGSKDVFIHISSLKKMSRRPKIGDTITFEIHTDNNGKTRAINAHIHGVATVSPQVRKAQKTKSSEGKGWLMSIVFLLFLGVAGYSIYERYFQYEVLSLVSNETVSTPVTKVQKPVKSKFSCAGKTRCGEMTSCKEAIYYLKNCPGTVMDGDNDGLPCERQWCN